MPAYAQIVCCFLEDPLQSLPIVSPTPPDFSLDTCLMWEHLEDLSIFKNQILGPDKQKLATHILLINELALTCDKTEKG